MAGPAQLALYVGLRHTLSRRSNRFVSLVAAISCLGLTLGVTSLIVVLSVMNGFGGELRGRILSVIPHLYVESAERQSLDNWQETARKLESDTRVIATAPYITSRALLRAGDEIIPVNMTAIDPAQESTVSAIAENMTRGALTDLYEEPYGIIAGSLVLSALGASEGDRVELVLPQLRTTPLGVFPRTRRFTVIGAFEVGAQLDGTEVFIPLQTGQRMLAMGEEVQGLRLKTGDIFSAPQLSADIEATSMGSLRAKDWSRTQGSLFQSIRMEKVMMTVLLLSVVAVAAFNIVSTLSMTVAEKRAEIAVLRTMGATPGVIVAIFMVQGMLIALAGIIAGAVLGILLAQNVSSIAGFIQSALGFQVFDPNVYFISVIPSDLQAQDVVVTCIAATLISVLAAVYPAWRASKIHPAEALRYAA